MFVEDELSAIVRERLRSASRHHIVLLSLGVADGRPATLAAVAAATGYSREGVRHCLTSLQESAARAAPAAPVLEQALSLAGEMAPCLDSEYGAALVDRRLARSPLSYTALARSAETLALEPPASLRLLPEGALLRVDQAAIYDGLPIALRKQAARSGVTQVERCAAILAGAAPADILPRLIRIRVTSDPSFRWIDAGSGWFWVPGGRNPLLGDIRKLLSVCSPASLESLHAGLSRFYRRHGAVPPPEILLEWCRQLPGLVVRHDFVAAEPSLDPRQALTAEELRLWEVLRASGGRLAERELRAEWAARGGNIGTLRVLRKNAPFVYRPGPRLYALRTPDLRAGAAQDVAARAREPVAVTEWTPGGKVTIAYTLTGHRVRNPFFRVPNVHWQSLRGQFRVLGPRGRDAGTVELKVRGGMRLDTLFEQARPQRGAQLVLEFDLATRVVRARFRQAE